LSELPRQPRRSNRLASLSPFAVAGVLLALGSCSSSRAKDDKAEVEKANLIQTGPEEPLGKLLADLDSAIGRWNALTLTASTPGDQREARLLEAVIVEQATKRRDELIAALESGPPINRIRAAGALGFSHAVEAQSPLLAALHDTHPDVVHNALMSLSILGRADTPLDEICALLENHSDPQTRGQAAYAVRSVLAAGGDSTAALGVARRGLNDTEPFVRSQCALALGIVADVESIPVLLDRLYDEIPLVGDASAEALVGVARKHESEKGAVARGLVEAYGKSDARLKRRAKQAMVRLSDVNYGDDIERWAEWAQRLP
jgi:HEAT repeat protein